MIICNSCGSQEQDGTRFCQSCGAAIVESPAENNQPAPEVNNQPPPDTNYQQPPEVNNQPPPAQNYQQAPPPVNNMQQPPPPYNYQQAPKDPDVEANKGMAILAYFIFFIPLVTGDYKKSPFVLYHTNQATILFITSIAISVATSIIRAVLRFVFWNWFGWGIFGLASTVLNTVMLIPIVLLILGVVNASNGVKKPLPVIGELFTVIK